MTERDWLDRDSPEAMVEYLCNAHPGYRLGRSRKLRLLACACCRRIEADLPLDEAREALDIAEKHAEGHALEMELRSSSAEVIEETAAHQGDPYSPELGALQAVACAVAPELSPAIQALFSWSAGAESSHLVEVDPKAVQANLVRCVFGNPFHPTSFDPTWRTPDVQHLALSIYDDRRFTDLPILGDALEDAGCQDGNMLHHCRNDRHHARGCWVVDLVLGKA